MKLLDFAHYEDFGHEWYVQVLGFYPHFALVDCVVQWDDYPATEWFPSILLAIGPDTIFYFSLRYKKFQIRVGLVTFNLRNLEFYKVSEK